MTASTWQRHLDVNLTGTFNVVQAAESRMERGGSIVLPDEELAGRDADPTSRC